MVMTLLSFPCTARSEDIAGEMAPVRCAVIRVLAATANSMRGQRQQAALEATYLGTGRLTSLKRPIQSTVEYILMCESLGDLPSEAASCLKDLAEAAQASDTEIFVADHAQNLVESISEVRG